MSPIEIVSGFSDKVQLQNIFMGQVRYISDVLCHFSNKGFGIDDPLIHTPGHTPGSVCFLANGNLFTGDKLFVSAVGRTDLTGGSLDTLLESLEKRLIILPGETVIWPGHDYGDTPTSTIAREMEENPYITDFLL